MKCKKCNADINLPVNLKGKTDESDISHFQCDNCKEYFCKEHLKPVYAGIDNFNYVGKETKVNYINLCEECSAKQNEQNY